MVVGEEKGMEVGEAATRREQRVDANALKPYLLLAHAAGTAYRADQSSTRRLKKAG